MSRITRSVVVALFSLTVWLPAALAQDAQDAGDTSAAPKKLDKATKRKMKQTLKELDNAYKQWLTEDVVYIITPEERNAFLQQQSRLAGERFQRRTLSPHRLCQRALCFRHPGLENRPRPHVHHVGAAGRD